MIDLFLCTTSPTAHLREEMFELCHERWQMEDGVNIIVLSPAIVKCSDVDFQRQRRIYADEHAKSSVYIVADDDCLPQSDPFAVEAAALMEYASEFRILSLMPTNARINLWTPNDKYEAFNDSAIMEHVSVGGVRFCRKHILSTWPPQHGLSYDMTQADAIRRIGRRVGYFRNFKMNHLGEGYSTVWRTDR